MSKEKTGKYVKKGDVEEWVWDDDGPGVPTLTGGWVVPEGEFDPTSAPPPEPSAAERATAPSQGLRLAPEPEAEPKPKAAEVKPEPKAEEPKRGPGRPRKEEA